jgi:hypothetical protein
MFVVLSVKDRLNASCLAAASRAGQAISSLLPVQENQAAEVAPQLLALPVIRISPTFNDGMVKK